MVLLHGIHHVATLTADLDRLIAFYQRIFSARLVADMEEEGLRHAFIELGPMTLLHPFQIPGIDVPQGELLIFERGRIDHFALQASTLEAFREVRRRAALARGRQGHRTGHRRRSSAREHRAQCQAGDGRGHRR